MAEETGSPAMQSVLRTFHLLDIVSRERKIWISELSRKAGLKKTTVARLVDTLEKAGALEQVSRIRKTGSILLPSACSR
ncbi:MAG: helix-turn-helix domain-containing protein [Peptococcaceae bacterium]|jgi:DNA-binding IclR family transcriptional regulator|nr:helix-turn-helix domain-containing protein [Peptococcaceae bacterium]